MRYVVVADIHGHAPALEAVLADARNQGAESIICLGDLIGSGTRPAETIKAVRARASVCVSGEHDAAEADRAGLDPAAVQWLSGLRPDHRNDVFACAHASFDAVPPVVDEPTAKALWSAMPQQLLFLGHTHEAALYVMGASGNPHKIDPCDFSLEEGKRYIVNPGSVGVGDAARYVIWDDADRTIEYKSVAMPAMPAAVAVPAPAPAPAPTSAPAPIPPRAPQPSTPPAVPQAPQSPQASQPGGLKPGLKLPPKPGVAGLKPGVKLPPKPGAILKPGVKLPPKPGAILKPGVKLPPKGPLAAKPIVPKPPVVPAPQPPAPPAAPQAPAPEPVKMEPVVESVSPAPKPIDPPAAPQAPKMEPVEPAPPAPKPSTPPSAPEVPQAPKSALKDMTVRKPPFAPAAKPAPKPIVAKSATAPKSLKPATPPAAPQAPQSPQAPQKKSKLPLIIAAVVLAAVGGAAAFMFMPLGGGSVDGVSFSGNDDIAGWSTSYENVDEQRAEAEYGLGTANVKFSHDKKHWVRMTKDLELWGSPEKVYVAFKPVSGGAVANVTVSFKNAQGQNLGSESFSSKGGVNCAVAVPQNADKASVSLCLRFAGDCEIEQPYFADSPK